MTFRLSVLCHISTTCYRSITHARALEGSSGHSALKEAVMLHTSIGEVRGYITQQKNGTLVLMGELEETVTVRGTPAQCAQLVALSGKRIAIDGTLTRNEAGFAVQVEDIVTIEEIIPPADSFAYRQLAGLFRDDEPSEVIVRRMRDENDRRCCP